MLVEGQIGHSLDHVITEGQFLMIIMIIAKLTMMKVVRSVVVEMKLLQFLRKGLRN